LERDRVILLAGAGAVVAVYILLSAGIFYLWGPWTLIPILVPVIGFLIFLFINWLGRPRV
jgi:hypothetical protein